MYETESCFRNFYAAATTPKGGSAVEKNDEILTGYSIDDFLKDQQGRGWKPDTRRRYRKYLLELREYLTRQGPPSETAVAKWRRQLQKRYGPSGVNACLAAANNYFRWCGRPDLVQTQQRRLDRDDQAPPALTRVEYLKLLRTARTQGRYRIYLLVKLFATTDLPLQCLDQVTVELVRQGRGSLNYRGSPVEFVCPAGLQKELLEYMELNGVYRGPVFVTRSGQPIDRSNLFRCMQELCRAAGVPEEKGNPRCLRNLYKATQQEIRDRLSALQQQMYDQLLDVEQEAVGWPVDRAADRGRPA